MYSGFGAKTDTGNENLDSITSYASGCLTGAANNVLRKVQEQGGYYDFVAVQSTIVKNHMVPYYSYHGKNLIPTESGISTEISKGVKTEFESCIAPGIQHYKDIGWKFTEISPITVTTMMKTNANSGNTTILITVNYPTKASLGRTSYIIGKMSYTTDTRIGVFLKAAEDCTKSWSQNPGWFNMNCVIENTPYYTISDWAQDSFSYFEYKDSVLNTLFNETHWRFALSP